MALPIRTRLVLAYGLVVTAALAALTAFTVREQRVWLLRLSTETLERSGRIAVRELAREAGSRGGDWAAVAADLGRLLACRVTLIDSTGRVAGDSDVPRTALARVENHAGRPEVRAALSGETGVATRRSVTVGREMLYVAMPGEVPPIAVVRVSQPLADISHLTTALLGVLVLGALAVLLAALAAVYRFSDAQAARVRELEAVAEAIESGAAAAHARETPDDELGRLGHALNRMSGTLRARLEALEREGHERERILAHLSDGVALLDGQGRVMRMNHGFATLVGAPLPAPAGAPFREYVRDPGLGELLEQVRREARTVETEVRLWSPTPRLVRATATPLSDPEHGAVLLVLHDLTEQERLDRMRQDFVANVSHELRTPLTSLRGYAETLLDGGLDDAEHREGFVRIMRDQAERLEALVGDLLSLAELERPGTRLRGEAIDLRELAERQAATFRQRAERAGLALVLEPGPPEPVTADRARLEQVLANLLDNAIKYTEHGTVRVTLGGDAEHVWCEVADTGAGIPAADQPRIFERFYRVDKARSREKGGTGLGLSIVKHIVTLHGGEVAVHSEPGAGSRFRFTIPRVPPAAAPA